MKKYVLNVHHVSFIFKILLEKCLAFFLYSIGPSISVCWPFSFILLVHLSLFKMFLVLY